MGLSDQDGDTRSTLLLTWLRTQLSVCCSTEHQDVENDDGRTPLLQATVVGHIKAVRALLDGGATVDASTKAGCTLSGRRRPGETALHAAASTGQRQ